LILPTLTLTAAALGAAHLYRNHLRRIPDAASIYPSFFRRRSIYGRVTSVGDGDGFRLYHTPGGRCLGWGWLPGRRLHGPTPTRDTLHIRIAGVDAPEGAHFGRTAQPYAAEALAWLREYLLGRNVRVYVYRRDQYERVVASVKVWRGFRRRDVGMEMLEAGMATVYEAKTGAEFGKLEELYRLAEWRARKARRGIWKQARINFVSPGQYKKALKE
ncbi:hypothetical protein DFP73DRAFT_455766, partial [Morchella snyderi]